MFFDTIKNAFKNIFLKAPFDAYHFGQVAIGSAAMLLLETSVNTVLTC